MRSNCLLWIFWKETTISLQDTTLHTSTNPTTPSPLSRLFHSHIGQPQWHANHMAVHGTVSSLLKTEGIPTGTSAHNALLLKHNALDLYASQIYMTPANHNLLTPMTVSEPTGLDCFTVSSRARMGWEPSPWIIPDWGPGSQISRDYCKTNLRINQSHSRIGTRDSLWGAYVLTKELIWEIDE